jgi:hypothetical protein
MDDLDIPAFLKISQEERAQAWRDWKGFPSAAVHGHRGDEDHGPGSVERRLGYPESPADALVREELNEGIRRATALKKEAGLARLAAWKAEQAEIAAVKAAACAQHSKKDESASVSAGRSQDSHNTATEHRHVSDSQYRT